MSATVKTRYIKALNGKVCKPAEMQCQLIHRLTDEEILVDVVCDDDSFATLSKAIRTEYPASVWGIFESWEIDQDNQARKVA